MHQPALDVLVGCCSMTDVKACKTLQTIFESVHVAADLGLSKRRCHIILQGRHAIVTRAKHKIVNLHMLVKEDIHVQMGRSPSRSIFLAQLGHVLQLLQWTPALYFLSHRQLAVRPQHSCVPVQAQQSESTVFRCLHL